MKKILLSLCAITALIAIAADPPIITVRDQAIENTADTVALKIRKPGTQTANYITIEKGGTTAFELPYTGVIPIAYGGTAAASASAARASLGVAAASSGFFTNGSFYNGWTTNATNINGKFQTGTFTNGAYYGGSESGVTNSDLTASLPVFTDANKVLETKTAVNARIALGVAAQDAGLYTNGTFYGGTFSGTTNSNNSHTGGTFETTTNLTGLFTNGTFYGGTITGSTNTTSTFTNGTYSGGEIVAGMTNTSLSASLPVFTDANKVFESKSVANTLLALGITSGTNVTSADASVTQAFGITYSALPVVVCQHNADVSPTNNVTSITTSNFVFSSGANGTGFGWIAIGAP